MQVSLAFYSEGRSKPPRKMLIADELVLVSETVEEELERWRTVIENKGLGISQSKTEYLVPSHQQGVGKLEGESLPLVNSFEVQYRWEWRAWKRCRWMNESRLVTMELYVVNCDKKVPVKLKSKLYTEQWSELRWCIMGVSVGHCANKKDSEMK